MKTFILQARLGKRRVNRQFASFAAARAEAQELARQFPEWGSRDFITITQKP